MTDNMELWNKVCTTDPSHTKHVSTRGGFTAIDAMYQIQCATEQFGVAGKGWGWSFTDPLFLPNGTVVIKCTLWHGNKDNTVEQFGQKKMGDDSRPDEDALKKAGTDALTKCLSYLGFNADVFLGKFDDSKYVEELRKDETAKKVLEEKRKKAETWVNDYLKKLELIKDDRAFLNLKTDNATMLKRVAEGYPSLHKVITEVTDKVRVVSGEATEDMPSPSNLTEG